MNSLSLPSQVILHRIFPYLEDGDVIKMVTSSSVNYTSLTPHYCVKIHVNMETVVSLIDRPITQGAFSHIIPIIRSVTIINPRNEKLFFYLKHDTIRQVRFICPLSLFNHQLPSHIEELELFTNHLQYITQAAPAQLKRLYFTGVSFFGNEIATVFPMLETIRIDVCTIVQRCTDSFLHFLTRQPNVREVGVPHSFRTKIKERYKTHQIPFRFTLHSDDIMVQDNVVLESDIMLYAKHMLLHPEPLSFKIEDIKHKWSLQTLDKLLPLSKLPVNQDMLNFINSITISDIYTEMSGSTIYWLYFIYKRAYRENAFWLCQKVVRVSMITHSKEIIEFFLDNELMTALLEDQFDPSNMVSRAMFDSKRQLFKTIVEKLQRQQAFFKSTRSLLYYPILLRLAMKHEKYAQLLMSSVNQFIHTYNYSNEIIQLSRMLDTDDSSSCFRQLFNILVSKHRNTFQRLHLLL